MRFFANRSSPRPARRGFRRLAVAAALAASAVAAATGSGAADADARLGADLAGLLSYAREHSAELAAMRGEADAALERVQIAGAWPDPMFRVEWEDLSRRTGVAALGPQPLRTEQTRYTLLQPLPLWGRRELRRDAAGADVEQAQARTGAAWAELAARIKTAHAQHYQSARSERVAHEIIELVTRLERVAQARYAGGLAPQQDAIRAQLELTAMRTELVAIENEKRQARARLNALLVRDIGAPLAEPAALRALPEATVLDAMALAERARERNPALAAEAARLRSAEFNRDLAYRSRYPDIQVGITPAREGTRISSWGLMVEMNIPLQQQARRAQEREAQAMVSAQRARSLALSSQLLGQLGENLAALDAARRNQALVATQLLPLSELALRSALAAYESGKVDFATLLDAQRQIRKARLDELKAEVEAQMRLAEIERIVGEDL